MAKEKLIISLIDKLVNSESQGSPDNNNPFYCQLGTDVIVRTYSAGCWFGRLDTQKKNEVYLTNARRMWKWKARQSISLSGVALYGLEYEQSQIAPPVKKIWIQAIEIIEMSNEAIKSLKGAANATPH